MGRPFDKYRNLSFAVFVKVSEVFRLQSSIENGAFFEKSQRYKPVKNFH